MNKLGLFDSSRKLVLIYAIGLVISIYLKLLISDQTSDVAGLKFNLGTKQAHSQNFNVS